MVADDEDPPTGSAPSFVEPERTAADQQPWQTNNDRRGGNTNAGGGAAIHTEQMHQWVQRAIGHDDDYSQKQATSQGTTDSTNIMSSNNILKLVKRTKPATTTTTTDSADDPNGNGRYSFSTPASAFLAAQSEESSSEKISTETSSTSATTTTSSSLLLQDAIKDPNTSPNDFDRVLAAELNQLTMEERERNYEQIHGVAPILDETPEFRQEKLLALQRAIDQTPLGQKQVYQEVISLAQESSSSPSGILGRTYLTSPRFQLQFLRAERFDVTKAAKRMLLCCEKKAQFFGRQTAGRALRLSDLTPSELKTLKAGTFQVLPQRDNSGRMVVIDTSLCGPKLYTDMFSYYKCFWYIILSAMEDDEESQKRGIVAIVWWMHHALRLEQDFDSDLRQETIASLSWLPMRPYSSTHVCFESVSVSSSPSPSPSSSNTLTGTNLFVKELMARFMTAVSPKEMRYGIQWQRGTHTEVLYKLLTYGIPVEYIPVTNSGVVKTRDFARWIQKRRWKDRVLLDIEERWREQQQQQQEEPAGPSSSSSSKSRTQTGKNSILRPEQCLFLEDRIDLPSNADVLLGAGKPLMKHPGNQQFRAIVLALAEQYDGAESIRGKAEMTWGIVRYIQTSCGGRFLKRSSGGNENGNDGDDDSSSRNNNNNSNREIDHWWLVASDKEARDKTGKGFISVRGKKSRKRRQTRPSGNDTDVSTTGRTISQVPLLASAAASPFLSDPSSRMNNDLRRWVSPPRLFQFADHSSLAGGAGAGVVEGWNIDDDNDDDDGQHNPHETTKRLKRMGTLSSDRMDQEQHFFPSLSCPPAAATHCFAWLGMGGAGSSGSNRTSASSSFVDRGLVWDRQPQQHHHQQQAAPPFFS